MSSCLRVPVILAACASCAGAGAQHTVEVLVHPAGQAYDTAYIRSYRDALVLTALVRHQTNDVELTGRTDRTLTYSTNNSEQIGIGIDLRWLTVEAAYSVPGVTVADPDKGNTKSGGFGFGLTGRKWWFRNFLSTNSGYYLTDPLLNDTLWKPGQDHPARGDLEQNTYMASINHGFNGRRYSHNASLWQLEQQRRSSGSWVVGGTLWLSMIRCEASLVTDLMAAEFSDTAKFNMVRRVIIGITGGYTHTFVFARNAFLNLMLVPGFTMERQWIDVIDQEEIATDRAAGGFTEFRFGLGWNADRWYVALTGNVYAASSSVGDVVELGTTYASVRLAGGIRLKKPRIKGLERIGL